MSVLDRLAESTRAAVTFGFARTFGGHAHSSETATSESISPRSATISVALGSSEQMRTGGPYPLTANELLVKCLRRMTKTAQKTDARAAAEQALFDAAERLLVDVGHA